MSPASSESSTPALASCTHSMPEWSTERSSSAPPPVQITTFASAADASDPPASSTAASSDTGRSRPTKTFALRVSLGSLTSQVDRARLRERARRHAGRESGKAACRKRRRNADREVRRDDRGIAEQDLTGVAKSRKLLLRVLGCNEQVLGRVLVGKCHRVGEV